MSAARPSRSLLAVLAVTAALLLAFGSKAFTIDDTLFLKLARHVQEDPLDFYGFNVNWYGVVLPMHEITKNPPLAGYFLALAGSVFGWSEWALHIAFLVPALFVAAGTHALARRFTTSPGWAVLAGLVTPVFLVSSSNVMCDTPMLAFWVWSLVFWLRGMDRERAVDLWIAATLAGFAFLTKYFGICLVPLLFADGLLRRRRLGTWCLPLLVPLAFALLYQWATDALDYGVDGGGLLTDAASFATGFQQGTQLDLWRRTLTGLSFAGGCLVPALTLAPALWRKRVVLVTLVLAIALGVWWVQQGELLAWDLDRLGRKRFRTAAEEAGIASQLLRVGYVTQFLLAVAGGLSLLGLVLSELRRAPRDPDAWLLAFWIGGTFTFATYVNWVNNGRSNLPMAPALGLLLVRHLQARPAPRPLLVAGGATAAVLAVLVAWADMRWAGKVRNAAKQLVVEYADREGTLWFQGHWGFQHYMEEGGAVALDVDRDFVRPGDLIVIPGNNVDVYEPPRRPSLGRVVDAFENDSAFLHTMQRGLGASFYASNLGQLPFVFGPRVADQYHVYRSKAHFQFNVKQPHHFQGPQGKQVDVPAKD